MGALQKKNLLLEFFAYKDGIGIACYAEPENVSSYSHGKTSLTEWLKKERGMNKEQDKTLESFMEELLMAIWAVIQFSKNIRVS